MIICKKYHSVIVYVDCVTFLLVWLRLPLLNNAYSLIKFILKQDEQRYAVNGYCLGNETKT